MEQIDWKTKDVVKPSKLKVGDIISYIWFKDEDSNGLGYEHTRQLLVSYREREVSWGTMESVTKYEFVCIILKTACPHYFPGSTCTFDLQRGQDGVRDYAAEYWRIYERAK